MVRVKKLKHHIDIDDLYYREAESYRNHMVVDENDFYCFFDGACYPNPGGKIGAGAIIHHYGNSIEIMKSFPEHVVNTSNVAEYIAFLCLVDHLLDITDGSSRVKIFGDSALVINQMNNKGNIEGGAYKEFALNALNAFQELKKKVYSVELSWVSRYHNTIADGLSNRAIREAEENDETDYGYDFC